MRFFVWGSYLLADWVADFVLGQLSGSMGDSSSSNIIIAFWAPFLILHLGGPDTITAYSIEDNELWARHLLGLVYELSIASYVIFRSLPDTRLLAPTLLIFVVAIIKYIERIYSLYIASAKGIRSSIISSHERISPRENLNGDLKDLNDAFLLYSITKTFFIDDLPRVVDHLKILKYLENMSEKEILRMTSIELSYAYDEFYTKAVINHSKVGYVLRVFCSICIFSAFSLFVLVPKNDFKSIDIVITYILLIGAICLDVAAIVMLMLSDWMVVTLLSIQVLRHWHCNWHELLAKYIVRIKNRCHKRRYWSIKSPQLNLFDNQLSYHAPNKSLKESIMNWVVEKLNLVQVRHLHFGRIYVLRMTQPVQATQGILETISSYLQRRFSESGINLESGINPSLFSAVHNVLTIPDFDVSKFVKIFEEFSFYQQVLVWHITTEICFRHDSSSQEMEACKYLSNYMMHTELMRQIMGVRENSPHFWTAVDKIIEFSGSGDSTHPFLVLPNVNVEDAIDGNLIMIGRAFARRMLTISDHKERLGIIIMAWMELLIREAKNSRANMHVKQLSLCEGDDLLTLIWDFIKNLNIDEVLINIEELEKNLEEAVRLLSEIEQPFRSNNMTELS